MSIFADFDAVYGNGTYSAVPGADGGMDVMHDGLCVEHIHHDGTCVKGNGVMNLQTHNPDGSVDIIKDGRVVSHVQPNVFGGEDVYHGTKLHSMTIPNEMGGVDIYSGDMEHNGMTMPNVFGGEDYLSAQGNISDIMQYDDPLSHVNQYWMSPFDVSSLG